MLCDVAICVSPLNSFFLFFFWLFLLESFDRWCYQSNKEDSVTDHVGDCNFCYTGGAEQLCAKRKQVLSFGCVVGLHTAELSAICSMWWHNIQLGWNSCLMANPSHSRPKNNTLVHRFWMCISVNNSPLAQPKNKGILWSNILYES